MLKNINDIIAGYYTGITIEVSIIVICWILVVIAVLIDLWTGIERAKKCGEKMHSHKFRATITKITEYWRIMIFGLFIDIATFIIFPHNVPFGTLLFMIACCGIEAKSVFENLRRKKSAAAQVPDALLKILEQLNSPEKISQYIEILTKLSNNNEQKQI